MADTRASARLGRPTASRPRPSVKKALDGVRIVSLAQNVPGPVALARLVAEGATACKIEPPDGDPLSTLSRAWYRELHRGVRVARIDLKSADGRARLERQLATADLLLTSQRPGALHRLGLDAPSLARRHAHLRVLQIVGDTAAPEEAGHDLTYQAQTGLLGAGMPRTLLADLFGAERAVIAALVLLRDAGPACARVGLRDALDTATLPIRHALTTPGGPLGGGLAAYRVYDTRRGRVAVAALEPHFRARLYRLLGLPDGHDLAEVLRSRTATQWERWAREHDLPLATATDPG